MIKYLDVTSHLSTSVYAVTSAFTAIHPVLNRNQRRYHVKKFEKRCCRPPLWDFTSKLACICVVPGSFLGQDTVFSGLFVFSSIVSVRCRRDTLIEAFSFVS
jgi:hypothetical protein